jgi:hypothetical protein
MISKKFLIFSNIFLPILHNIGLYIYTVKYKSYIKIPGFLQNISKINSKHLKKTSKTFKLISHFKYIYIHAYYQILKFSKHIFIKKTFASFSCFENSKKKMYIITSL